MPCINPCKNCNTNKFVMQMDLCLRKASSCITLQQSDDAVHGTDFRRGIHHLEHSSEIQSHIQSRSIRLYESCIWRGAFCCFAERGKSDSLFTVRSFTDSCLPRNLYREPEGFFIIIQISLHLRGDLPLPDQFP